MNLQEVESFAKELLVEYKLLGWKFTFTNRLTQYGYCSFRFRTIGLSKHVVQHCGEEEILDTILHEIAHALVGVEHGHDEVWKRKCREIGARPQRCSSARILTAGHKYEFRCAPCEQVYPMYKKPRGTCGRRCNKCKTVVTFHVVG